MDPGVVVVGGGFAALEISLALRRLRSDLPVTVVSNETCLAYRPWLIKVPAGGPPPPVIPFARLLDSARVERISTTAVGVDLEGRQVVLESGAAIRYSQLVVASGAVADRDRVVGARANALFPCDSSDAATFADRVLAGVSRVAVVFGWERPGPGLEYAAWIAAHRRGVRVTAIDADGTLARRFGDRATARIARIFERRGGILIADGSGMRIDEGAVQLPSGAVVADVIALAAPLRGATTWLPGELLDGRGMLKVDSAMAAAPGVFGIGDVVAVPATHRLAPSLQSIRGTAGRIANNVVRSLERAALQPVLRPGQPDMVGPDLAGDAVLVRNRKVVMSGWIALRMRSFIDRTYLRRRGADMGGRAELT